MKKQKSIKICALTVKPVLTSARLKLFIWNKPETLFWSTDPFFYVKKMIIAAFLICSIIILYSFFLFLKIFENPADFSLMAE